ncbi:Transcription factor [Balamuthia mandrillaris]
MALRTNYQIYSSYKQCFSVSSCHFFARGGGFSTSTEAGTPPTQGKVLLEKWTANELQEWLRVSPYAEYAKLFKGLPGASVARYTEEQLIRLIPEASKAIALFNDLRLLDSPVQSQPFTMRFTKHLPPVHNVLTGRSAVEGFKVEYKEPPIFKQAYGDLTFYVRSLPNGWLDPKCMRCVFIDGGSGCGKTRLGYELYRKMLTDPDFTTIGGPDYLDCINYAIVVAKTDWVDISPYDSVTAGRVLAKALMQQYGPSEAIQASEGGLSAVLPLLARAETTLGVQEGRAALVLHIDELNNRGLGVAAMLRAIRDFNTTNSSKTTGITAVLPVLTGLLVDEPLRSMAHSGVSDMQPIVHTLHYLSDRKHIDDVFDIVKSAARAVGCQQLDEFMSMKSLEDQVRSRPTLAYLLYLVRDTMGWPQAAVQLGGAIAFNLTFFNLDNLQPTGWEMIENIYLQVLSQKYSGALVNQLFGKNSNGLTKLFNLALCPHSVHLEEPINGGHLMTLREYGLVDLVPDQNSCLPGQHPKRYYIRMSMPILAIVNAGFVPQRLLRTCRASYNDVQEEAQLYSLAISFNALCLLQHAPPPITLRNLRPGADFYGRGKGKDVLDLPLVSPEEVKQALQSGKPLQMEVEERGTKPSKPLAGALCKAGEVAMDSYVVFEHGHYVMQSKGSQFGATPHRTIRPSEVAAVLGKLAKKVPGALGVSELEISTISPRFYSSFFIE